MSNISKFADPHILYLNNPTDEITIEEFSNLCVVRVKLLRQIEQICENVKLKGDNNEIKFNDRIQVLAQTSIEDKSKDLISHYITRLAFCHDDTNAQWLINQEARLFKARIQQYSLLEKKIFAEKLKINFEVLNANDWKDQEFRNNLIDSTYRKSFKNNLTLNFNDFYKVNFKNALYFVSNMKCYLHKGNAYLYMEDITNLIVLAFREKLQKSLLTAKLNYDKIIEEDSRLAPLLKNVSAVYMGKDYSNIQTTSKRGKINLADIEVLSKRSFPPCMRYIYENLKLTHHLKHEGRLQLGLFLKGIGLSLEDSLILWKTEMTKKMTSDQFERNYAYNIRHNYGKEGKRVDYNPQSCDKIIRNHMAGNSEYHGCPFRQLSENNLIILLRKMGVETNTKEFQEVLEKTRDKHFQIACKYVYQILHPKNQNIEIDFDGQHPNNYFESSLNYYNPEKNNIKK